MVELERVVYYQDGRIVRMKSQGQPADLTDPIEISCSSESLAAELTQILNFRDKLIEEGDHMTLLDSLALMALRT